MSRKNNGFSIAGLIDIGAITTILVALLYTAGWSYAYHYFSRFHLGLLGLDIKREYFFLYGFWVFKDSLVAVSACLFVRLGCIFFSAIYNNKLWRTKNRVPRRSCVQARNHRGTDIRSGCGPPFLSECRHIFFSVYRLLPARHQGRMG